MAKSYPHGMSVSFLISSVFDALRANCALVDDTGTILAVNRAWRDFGRRNGLRLADDGVGANYLEATDNARGRGSEQAAGVARKLRLVLAGQSAYETADYPCHSAVEQRWFSLSITTVIEAGRRYALVSHTNITADRLAQQRLAARQLKQVIDASTDAIAALDLDFRFIACNEAYSQEIQEKWGADVGPGTSWKELMKEFEPEHLSRLAALWRRAMKGEAFSMVRQNSPPQRDPRVFEVHYSGIRDEDGHRIGAIEVSRDVTARQEFERELIRARDAAEEGERAKAAFVATVSHEIRTPMNAVVGMTDMLLDTFLDDEQREYAQNIQQATSNLLTLVNDILDFSRLEAGRLTIEQSPFDLGSCIREAVELMQPQIQARGLGMEFTTAPATLPRLSGDAGRIRQVLLNLLSNAIKFTHEGQIEVRVLCETRAPDRVGVHIAVRDTGIGMPKAAKQRLFESFTQLDNGSTRRYGGSGLGLAISKSLVELMGGKIGIDSEPGAGTTAWFTLTLPAAPLEHPVNQSAPAAESGWTVPMNGHCRVLLVEDNAVNQRLGQRQLEKLGLRVNLAADGAEAVELCRNIAYDLILMDCQMPVLDGYEATRRIRELGDWGRGVPIVALTANAFPEDRQRCFDAGMNAHLAKPIRFETLRDTLAWFLNKGSGAAETAILEA